LREEVSVGGEGNEVEDEEDGEVEGGEDAGRDEVAGGMMRVIKLTDCCSFVRTWIV